MYIYTLKWQLLTILFSLRRYVLIKKYCGSKEWTTNFSRRFLAQSHLESHDVSRLSIKAPFARCFYRFTTSSSTSLLFGTHKEQFHRWSGTLSPRKIMSQENPLRRWKATRGKKAGRVFYRDFFEKPETTRINHEEQKRRDVRDRLKFVVEGRSALFPGDKICLDILEIKYVARPARRCSFNVDVR